MKRFFTFLCIAVLATNLWGTEVQVGTYVANNKSISLPMVMESTSYGSLCQMLYLSSEVNLSDDASRDLTGLSFYFKGASQNITRNIEVWLMLSTSISISGNYFIGNYSSKNAGTKVFDGQVTLPATGGWYDISFNEAGSTPFTWTKQTTASSPKLYNLVVTVYDKTNSRPSGGTYHATYTATANRSRYKNCTSTDDVSSNAASKAYNAQGAVGTTMPLIKFTFAGGDKPDAPSNVVSSSVAYNSATISWDAVDGADSYSLQYKKSGAAAYTTINNITTTSYSLSDLEPSTQYIYGVKTVKGTESSEFTADANFTTLAEPAHTHNDITFTKWTSTDALPNAAGNYYLANNVTCNSTATISNAINLCLNGKTIDMGSNKIQVKGSLAIYDCKDEGKITSSYSSNMFGGTIHVDDGTVSLYEGNIENTSKEANAFCVYNNGTLQLGGTTSFSSEKANICLHTSSRKITILSGFAPSEPISVGGLSSSENAFTTGWSSAMGSEANIANYFTPANSNQSFAVIDGELKLAQLVTLDENATNNNLTNNPKCNVQLMRSFSNASYSTICLPFALSKTKIETAFGAGTKVQALTNSSLSEDGTELTLDFSEVENMEATKPYIIKPANATENPTFEEVTISGDAAATIGETDYVKMVGFYNQTLVAAGQKEVLVLSADNELKWLSNDGYVKGTRAYFRISYPAGAAAPARMHMSLGNSTPTGINPLQQASSCIKKQLINGQLLIIRDGKAYNAQGQKIND